MGVLDFDSFEIKKRAIVAYYKGRLPKNTAKGISYTSDFCDFCERSNFEKLAVIFDYLKRHLTIAYGHLIVRDTWGTLR